MSRPIIILARASKLDCGSRDTKGGFVQHLGSIGTRGVSIDSAQAHRGSRSLETTGRLERGFHSVLVPE